MTVKVVEEKKVQPSVAIQKAKANRPVRSSLHTGKSKLTDKDRMVLKGEDRANQAMRLDSPLRFLFNPLP